MSPKTAAFHMGGRRKGKNGNAPKNPFLANREHNIRDPSYVRKQKHIKENTTEGVDYEILYDQTWEQAYEEHFSEGIKKYDAEQKRSDRKIKSSKNYLQKIINHKTKVPVYESIVTVGNAQNPVTDVKLLREIYKDYFEEFKTRYRNFKVCGAYVHWDESRHKGVRYDTENGLVRGEPHMHLDFIPVSEGREERFKDRQNADGKKTKYVRGMDVENSLTEALEQMGFTSKELSPKAAAKKGMHRNEKKFKDPERQKEYEAFMDARDTDTREYYGVMFFEKDARDLLIQVAERHGVHIKNPNEHRSHVDTDEYSKTKSVEETINLNLSLTEDLENIKADLNRSVKETKDLKKRYEEVTEKYQKAKSDYEKNSASLKLRKSEYEEKERKLTEKEQILNVREERAEKAIKLEELAEQKLKEAKDLQVSHEQMTVQVENEVWQKYKPKLDEVERKRKENEETLNEIERQKQSIQKKQDRFREEVFDYMDNKIDIPDELKTEYDLPKPTSSETAMSVWNRAKAAIHKIYKHFSKAFNDLKRSVFGHTFETKDDKGRSVIMHAYGKGEIGDMFIESDAATFRNIASEMDETGSSTFYELYEKDQKTAKPKLLSRHFKRAKEIELEIERLNHRGITR